MDDLLLLRSHWPASAHWVVRCAGREVSSTVHVSHFTNFAAVIRQLAAKKRRYFVYYCIVYFGTRSMPVVHVIDLYGMESREYLPVPEEVQYG